MKGTSLLAFAVAGAICLPCMGQGHTERAGVDEGMFRDGLDESMSLLGESSVLLSEMPQQRGHNEAPPEFEGGMMPPAPDMESAGMDARRGDKGQGMMQQQQRQGRQGGMMQKKMGGMGLEAGLAVDDPAKYEEFKKLKEQQGKILKEYAEKQKAERAEFKKLLDDYRDNPSGDAKAKLKAKLAEKFDARIKAKEVKLEEAKAAIAKERESRDSKIDEMLERISSRQKDGRGAPPPPQES